MYQWAKIYEAHCNTDRWARGLALLQKAVFAPPYTSLYRINESERIPCW